MSLNQSFATLKNSVDFTVNENYTQTDLKSGTAKHCGILTVGSVNIPLTMNDLERIIDISCSARETLYKMHKLGIMPS